MNNDPLVSVIVPTFNRAHLLGRALDSIKKQTFKSFEVLVVDDGSFDYTAKLVRESYPEFKLLKIKNSGVSAARNVGIHESRGKYIALLDSDDEWLPEKLEKQISLFKQSHFRWVHSNERWIRNGTRVNQKKIHKKSGGDIFLRSLHLCLVSPSAVILEKSLLLEVGCFDESFTVCEDFDLWLRILTYCPIGFLEDELILKYGGHEDQLSAKYKAMDEYRVRCYRKLLLEYNLSEVRREEVIKAAIKKCDILINGYKKHGHLESFKKIEISKNWFKQQHLA